MATFIKGLEQFDDEEYESAIVTLTHCLDTEDPKSRAKILEKRASAHLQLANYEAAAEDASASLLLSPNSQNGWLSKGEAMFHLDEYETAKVSFEKGFAVKGDTGKKASLFQKWINKCLAELEDDDSEDELREGEDTGEAKETTPAPTTTPSPPTPTPTPTTVTAPLPKFRHDWYQTSDTVVLTVMAKKQDPTNVTVDITENNLMIEIKLEDGSGSSFVLDLDLFDAIDPAQSNHRLSPFKLEVKLRKKEAYKWGTLEATDAALASRIPTSSDSTATSSTSVQSAYSGKKDWNAIEQQMTKDEADEKPEGEEALNALFRQIYGNANPETRRAMNKSFQTSGGTVLSTNWGEVGDTDYEKDRQAPEGMEWKNWDGAKLDKEGNPMKKP